MGAPGACEACGEDPCDGRRSHRVVSGSDIETTRCCDKCCPGIALWFDELDRITALLASPEAEEAAARAMAERDKFIWDNLTLIGHKSYRDIADAALAAITALVRPREGT